MPENGWTAYGGGSVENWKCTIKTDNKKDGPLRLTQGPTFFICGVVISARQKFALVFSLIFSLNTLLPAVSLWYGLVQRNAPNPCSTRLSGIVWYGLVGPDMAFGQIQVLYRPPMQRNPNLFPIGDGFGFVLYLDDLAGWRKRLYLTQIGPSLFLYYSVFFFPLFAAILHGKF